MFDSDAELAQKEIKGIFSSILALTANERNQDVLGDDVSGICSNKQPERQSFKYCFQTSLLIRRLIGLVPRAHHTEEHEAKIRITYRLTIQTVAGVMPRKARTFPFVSLMFGHLVG